MVPNNESEEQIRQSVESIQRAARAAHLDLDLAVVGTPSQAVLKRAPAGCRLDSAQADGFDSSVWHWFQHIEQTKPDFFFRLRPGETVAPNYFQLVGEALEIEPRVGWATTWLESVDDRPQRPFVGFDFSLPLEMICYHAIPFGVIRYEAYREVGGYNFDLPTGWRDWDLYLALHGAGWHGKVHASWGGRYIPWWGIELATIEHPKAQELVLERIVRRNRKAFEEHGAWLWVSMVSNQSARRAEQKARDQAETKTPVAHSEPPPPVPANRGLVGSTVRRFRRLFKSP
jgi:hypothetical protein